MKNNLILRIALFSALLVENTFCMRLPESIDKERRDVCRFEKEATSTASEETKDDLLQGYIEHFKDSFPYGFFSAFDKKNYEKVLSYIPYFLDESLGPTEEFEKLGEKRQIETIDILLQTMSILGGLENAYTPVLETQLANLLYMQINSLNSSSPVHMRSLSESPCVWILEYFNEYFVERGRGDRLLSKLTPEQGMNLVKILASTLFSLNSQYPSRKKEGKQIAEEWYKNYFATWLERYKSQLPEGKCEILVIHEKLLQLIEEDGIDPKELWLLPMEEKTEPTSSRESATKSEITSQLETDLEAEAQRSEEKKEAETLGMAVQGEFSDSTEREAKVLDLDEYQGNEEKTEKTDLEKTMMKVDKSITKTGDGNDKNILTSSCYFHREFIGDLSTKCIKRSQSCPR